jgi:hypothetical protein
MRQSKSAVHLSMTLSRKVRDKLGPDRVAVVEIDDKHGRADLI